MTDPQAIVDKLLEVIWEKPGFGEDRWIEFREKIAAALREYGEACVEEAICEDCGYAGSLVKNNLKEAHAQGRAEALEEAAKVVEGGSALLENEKQFADKIRNLT